jgi:hypothetical protein
MGKGQTFSGMLTVQNDKNPLPLPPHAKNESGTGAHG